MYLIKYQFITEKTSREEWFFFTDYYTKRIINEWSKIVDTEEEVKNFNNTLTNWNIISVTKF